jgi:phosphate transport system substrate-binding protein
MNTKLFRKNNGLKTVSALWLATLLGLSIAAAEDKIKIRGSNTIGEELAPRLVSEYKKSHNGVTFDTEFKGSVYGIGSLMGGYCDIAGSSKPVMKEQEEVALIHGVKFKEFILGSYTVCILVNSNNAISNLTSNQIQGLFTGQVQNWKEVGGPDAPVQVLVRDPVSGTHFGFKEIALANQEYASRAQFFTNYLGIADAVAKDPFTLGYAGLNLAQHPGTKALSVDGVAPNAANVNTKKYPYVRSLRFYTDAAKETAATKDFISFVLAPSGQEILTQLGYAPKP